MKFNTETIVSLVLVLLTLSNSLSIAKVDRSLRKSNSKQGDVMMNLLIRIAACRIRRIEESVLGKYDEIISKHVSRNSVYQNYINDVFEEFPPTADKEQTDGLRDYLVLRMLTGDVIAFRFLQAKFPSDVTAVLDKKHNFKQDVFIQTGGISDADMAIYVAINILNVNDLEMITKCTKYTAKTTYLNIEDGKPVEKSSQYNENNNEAMKKLINDEFKGFQISKSLFRSEFEFFIKPKLVDLKIAHQDGFTLLKHNSATNKGANDDFTSTTKNVDEFFKNLKNEFKTNEELKKNEIDKGLFKINFPKKDDIYVIGEGSKKQIIQYEFGFVKQALGFIDKNRSFSFKFQVPKSLYYNAFGWVFDIPQFIEPRVWKDGQQKLITEEIELRQFINSINDAFISRKSNSMLDTTLTSKNKRPIVIFDKLIFSEYEEFRKNRYSKCREKLNSKIQDGTIVFYEKQLDVVKQKEVENKKTIITEPIRAIVHAAKYYQPFDAWISKEGESYLVLHKSEDIDSSIYGSPKYVICDAQ